MATNPQARMTRLIARIDATTLTAFDAYAQGRGGRSAVLRNLIVQAAEANVDKPHFELPDGAASSRVSTSAAVRCLAYWAEQPKVPAMRSIVGMAAEGSILSRRT